MVEILAFIELMYIECYCVQCPVFQLSSILTVMIYPCQPYPPARAKGSEQGGAQFSAASWWVLLPAQACYATSAWQMLCHLSHQGGPIRTTASWNRVKSNIREGQTDRNGASCCCSTKRSRLGQSVLSWLLEGEWGGGDRVTLHTRKLRSRKKDPSWFYTLL